MTEAISKDQIQSDDVLCCKSSFAFGHNGNQKFRQLIQKYRAPYQSAAKKHKQTFIQSIITAVHESNGRFLRPSDDNHDLKAASTLWTTLTSEQLQSKVGHALRSGKKKSSNKSTMKSSNPSKMPSAMSPPMSTMTSDIDEEFPSLSMPVTVQQVSKEYASPLRERPFEYFLDHQRSLLMSLQNETHGMARTSLVEDEDGDDLVSSLELLHSPPDESTVSDRAQTSVLSDVDMFDMLSDVDFDDFQLDLPEGISLIDC